MSAECGTYSGYQRHRRRGEETCQPCRAAATAYQREHRASNPDVRAKDRAFTRAQSRALFRLAAMHPGMFRALLAEERSRAS